MSQYGSNAFSLARSESIRALMRMGLSPSAAARSYSIRRRFLAAERAGLVSIRLQADPLGVPDGLRIIGSYRVSRESPWIVADSCWGFVGTDAPAASGYLEDIQASTLAELRNALKSRCPLCRQPSRDRRLGKKTALGVKVA